MESRDPVEVIRTAAREARQERFVFWAQGTFAFVEERFPHLIAVSPERWVSTCAAAMAIVAGEVLDRSTGLERLFTLARWKQALREDENTKALRVYATVLKHVADSGRDRNAYQSATVGIGLWLVQSNGLSAHSGGLTEWAVVGDVFCLATLRAIDRPDMLERVTELTSEDSAAE